MGSRKMLQPKEMYVIRGMSPFPHEQDHELVFPVLMRRSLGGHLGVILLDTNNDNEST